MFKLKYRICEENAGNGDGAGGGGQPNRQQNQNNAQNNAQNNLSPYADLWQTANNESNQGNNQQQTTQSNNQGQPDPNKVMSDHIASLKLAAGVDTDAIMSGLRDGDPTALQSAFESVAAKAYQSAITTMNSVVEQRVKKAVEEASNNASSSVNTNLAIRELNEKLPFTAEPEVAPIAKAVFMQMMKKGKSVQEAISETGKYFGHVSKIASKFVDTTPPQSRSGANSFNRQQSNNNSNDNEPDWMSILGGDNE